MHGMNRSASQKSKNVFKMPAVINAIRQTMATHCPGISMSKLPGSGDRGQFWMAGVQVA